MIPERVTVPRSACRSWQGLRIIPVSKPLPAASGGDGELTYTLDPDVPGLEFDAATRTLSGMPATAGDFAYEIRCSRDFLLYVAHQRAEGEHGTR